MGRLNAYEERIKDEDQPEDQGKLLCANTDGKGQQESYGRGRGQGGRYNNRGRGRGRYNGRNNWTQGRDASRVYVIVATRPDIISTTVPIVCLSSKKHRRMRMITHMKLMS